MAVAARTRDPEGTRARILDAAFEEFYRNGFQAGSLDRIVDGAGVTKGALYHHFRDKAALGYAVLEEVIREPILRAYLGPLEDDGGDPLTALQNVLRRRAEDFAETGIALGCPLNNLAQEMSALDEGFRRRIAATLGEWTDAFAATLARARDEGHVREDVDPRRVASFIVASVEGAFGLAKNAGGDVAILRSNLDVLAEFLESLRAG